MRIQPKPPPINTLKFFVKMLQNKSRRVRRIIAIRQMCYEFAFARTNHILIMAELRHRVAWDIADCGALIRVAEHHRCRQNISKFSPVALKAPYEESISGILKIWNLTTNNALRKSRRKFRISIMQQLSSLATRSLSEHITHKGDHDTYLYPPTTISAHKHWLAALLTSLRISRLPSASPPARNPSILAL